MHRRRQVLTWKVEKNMYILSWKICKKKFIFIRKFPSMKLYGCIWEFFCKLLAIKIKWTPRCLKKIVIKKCANTFSLDSHHNLLLLPSIEMFPSFGTVYKVRVEDFFIRILFSPLCERSVQFASPPLYIVTLGESTLRYYWSIQSYDPFFSMSFISTHKGCPIKKWTVHLAFNSCSRAAIIKRDPSSKEST